MKKTLNSLKIAIVAVLFITTFYGFQNRQQGNFSPGLYALTFTNAQSQFEYINDPGPGGTIGCQLKYPAPSQLDQYMSCLKSVLTGGNKIPGGTSSPPGSLPAPPCPSCSEDVNIAMMDVYWKVLGVWPSGRGTVTIFQMNQVRPTVNAYNAIIQEIWGDASGVIVVPGDRQSQDAALANYELNHFRIPGNIYDYVHVAYNENFYYDPKFAWFDPENPDLADPYYGMKLKDSILFVND